MGIRDDLRKTFECAKCGEGHVRSLRELEVDPVIRCPCGTDTRVDVADMSAMADLHEGLRKRGGKL